MPLRATPLATAAFELAPPPDSFPRVFQKPRLNWCWAACAQMVLETLLGKSPEMCAMANFLFKAAGCCKDPQACDNACQPDQICDVFTEFGLTCDGPHDPLPSEEALQAELERGPVLVVFDFRDHRRHAAVVFAAGRDENGVFFTVHDPLFPVSPTLPFVRLQRFYGRGKWTATWLGFAPA